MVVGGSRLNVDLNSVEIIDLSSTNSTCQPVQNYPIKLRGVSGGLLESKTPFVCGGQEPATNKCFKYIKPNWIPFAGMTIPRFHFSILPITNFGSKKAFLFATGSLDVTYSEIYDGNVWSRTNISDISFTTYVSCVTYVNDTTIMLSGGMQGQNTNGEKVFFMSLVDNFWVQGPSLITGRFAHSCGQINKNENTNQKSIIVAGGMIGTNYAPIDDVEILNDGAKNWRPGEYFKSKYFLFNKDYLIFKNPK